MRHSQCKMYTAISRKVVGKHGYATTPKGNMGYDQYTLPNDCSCRTYFCCFPLALANIGPWPLMPFFQISLENRADKTTHNTFRDCRVHFFRQPFSKQLYTWPTRLQNGEFFSVGCLWHSHGKKMRLGCTQKLQSQDCVKSLSIISSSKPTNQIVQNLYRFLIDLLRLKNVVIRTFLAKFVALAFSHSWFRMAAC